MQAECRAPQWVTQVDMVDRLGLLLQPAMQVCCSPLQRMGAAIAGRAQSRTVAAKTATASMEPTSLKMTCRESTKDCMTNY